MYLPLPSFVMHKYIEGTTMPNLVNQLWKDHEFADIWAVEPVEL